MVVELYDTERSYVEALQILVNVSTFTKFDRSEKRDRLFTKLDFSFARRKKLIFEKDIFLL